MKHQNFFPALLQGALIGLGAVLPGISGGVLSVIVGIYRPVMELLGVVEGASSIPAQHRAAKTAVGHAPIRTAAETTPQRYFFVIEIPPFLLNFF